MCIKDLRNRQRNAVNSLATLELILAVDIQNPCDPEVCKGVKHANCKKRYTCSVGVMLDAIRHQKYELQKINQRLKALEDKYANFNNTNTYGS